MALYAFGMEVGGPFGFWADVSTGSEMKTLPIPTNCGCIGMLESVCRTMGTKTTVVGIGVCKQPQYTRYTYNSFSNIRKSNLLPNPEKGREAACSQIRETVLTDCCFQIIAVSENFDGKGFSEKAAKHRGNNNAHAHQERFFRHLRQHRYHDNISLGRREFLVSYFGPFVSSVVDFSEKFPTILVATFDDYGKRIKDDSRFRQDLEVVNGVMDFGVFGGCCLKDGKLAFKDQSLQQQLEYYWRKNDKRTV